MRGTFEPGAAEITSGAVVLVVDYQFAPVGLTLVLRFQIRETHEGLHGGHIRRRLNGLGGVEDFGLGLRRQNDDGMPTPREKRRSIGSWLSRRS